MTITPDQRMQNFIEYVQISDGLNGLDLINNSSDSQSGNIVLFPTLSFLMGYSGTNFERIRTSQIGITSTPTGYVNTISGIRYFSSTQIWAPDQIGPARADQNGNLCINAGYYNTAPNNGTISLAATTWTKLIAANQNRTGWSMQNQHATAKVYYQYTNTAPTGAPDGNSEILYSSSDIRSYKEQSAATGNCTNTDVWVYADTASTVLNWKEYS